MRSKVFKTKLPAVLLTLCMVLSMMSITVFAADPAAETADFTDGRGETAIKLLNQYKTGSADSLWYYETKTLELWGVDFTTTAQTAVKLPAGSTIILKDGTHSTIRSGDVTINVSGQHKNPTYINALDAAGSLTVQGGTAGTGTLSVYAGKVINESDGWTFSSGISVNGDFTVKSGHVTAQGGHVEGKNSVFSVGVNMDNDIKNKALLVTGGSLSAIAGEAYEIQDDGSKSAKFSRGVYMFQGNVIVSGTGGLRAESVEKMADGGLLSDGLYISSGSLTVANSAEVAVAGAYGAYISGGSIDISGGKLTAVSTQTNSYIGNALDVEVDKNVADSGNITVTGGTLETSNGKIYVSTFGAKENQGLFTVTGGSIVNRDQLQGSGLKLNISGGSVQTKGMDVGALTLSGGTLTIREPVRKSPYSGELYALPALDVGTFTVSGGTLDAAWDWGEYTPIVLSKNEEYNDVGILVRMPYDFNTAAFTGGTTLLDTGFAGNTALLIKGTLTLGDGMAETGADVNHCQLGTAPVKIAAFDPSAPKEIEVVEITGATLTFQDGDTPVFTGKAPDGAPYKLIYEAWQTDGEGLSSEEWFNNEDHLAIWGGKLISTFDKNKTYTYKLYLTTTAAGSEAGYYFGTNTKLKINDREVTFTRDSDDNEQQFSVSSLTMTPTEQTPSTIASAAVENAKFDYQPGDAPQATAAVAAADADKYEIVYECWQQFENNEPVAAWYSDNGSHGSLPTITEFENGKRYVYSLMLQPKDGYSFSSETVVTVNAQRVSAPFVGGSMYIPAVKTITPTKQTPGSINSVDVENIKLNYQPGETPQPTARRVGVEQDKYDILYESWGKREKDADDTITTVAYWYSDESYYSDGAARFNTFEKGGRYQYSVRLRAKDGYTFDSNLNNNNVTLNGQSLPFGSWVNVLDDGKTCLITYGAETRPGQVVESIRLDAVIDFSAGDQPRFSTGIIDPLVDTDHQRWDANDGSGYGITSSDYWNSRYNGKLITAFEDGKSYTYSVYFKISDIGMEEGYRFDKNTKLYINGEQITLSPDQISLDDNGETIWFSNVLTMTPKPAVSLQKIDVVEIEGATVNFKDGDKPVFTGKTPENAPYIYQFECWETKDGAGVNSAEFFDNAYEKHITAFKNGETYQYILYMKAKEGYYFTADTKIKINGTLYSYRLVNIDPDYDSSGRMYTFWAYTDLTTLVSVKAAEKFIDVKSGAWYEQYIDYVATYGLMNGMSATTFEPTSNLTRAMFVQILANLEGVDTTDKTAATIFEDVPAGKWYTPAVKWANENGIVDGIKATIFNPMGNIQRQQMCVMLVRYAKYKGITLKTDVATVKFADDARIQDYAKDAVYACQAAGIVSGKTPTTFEPRANATRAEVAKIITVFHKDYMAK